MTTPIFALSPEWAEWWEASARDFLTAYQTSMRSSLFSGFLTLCGFLMSAKTFIVVNMKKEVYDKEGYQKNWLLQKKLNPSLSLYGPLHELSKWLVANVILSLVTSSAQFTVGFIPHWLAAVVCVLLAAVTLFVLARSLWHISSNLASMFRYMEDQQKLEDQQKAAMAVGEQPKPQG